VDKKGIEDHHLCVSQGVLLIGLENRRPWPENPWTSKAGLFLQFVTLCAFVCLCQNIFIAFLGVSLLLLPCVLLAKCSSRPWSGGLVDIFHRLLLWPQFMMRIGLCSTLASSYFAADIYGGKCCQPRAYWVLGLRRVLHLVRCLMSSLKVWNVSLACQRAY